MLHCAFRCSPGAPVCIPGLTIFLLVPFRPPQESPFAFWCSPGAALCLCSQRLASLARPHTGPQEVGSPAVAGDCVPQDGGGTGPAVVVLVLGQFQTVPIPSLQGLCPTLAVPWVSQNGDALSLPVSPTAPGLSPCWFLHPFLSLHCLQTLQQGWVRL